MKQKETIEGYSLDDEGYYVTNEIYRVKIRSRKCTLCGNFLILVYSEKYLYFEKIGMLMIMGEKVYGFECDTCNCGFIYNNE